MNTTIKFYQKDVYGNTNTYVTDVQQARLITGLTGRKTLSERDMANLTALFGTVWEETFAPVK